MPVVRDGVPEDAREIARIHVHSWREAYAGIMPAQVLAGLDIDAGVARRRGVLERAQRGEGVAQTLIAVDDRPGASGALGFAVVGPYRNGQRFADLDHRYGEVYAIYVDPPAVGTGVGLALMRVAVARLTGAGHREVRLWVLEANQRARRFYQRFGFVADGQRSMYPVDVPDRDPVLLAELRYTLTLDQAGAGSG